MTRLARNPVHAERHHWPPLLPPAPIALQLRAQEREGLLTALGSLLVRDVVAEELPVLRKARPRRPASLDVDDVEARDRRESVAAPGEREVGARRDSALRSAVVKCFKRPGT